MQGTCALGAGSNLHTRLRRRPRGLLFSENRADRIHLQIRRFKISEFSSSVGEQKPKNPVRVPGTHSHPPAWHPWAVPFSQGKRFLVSRIHTPFLLPDIRPPGLTFVSRLGRGGWESTNTAAVS